MKNRLISFFKKNGAGATPRKFQIAAITLPITYNSHGDFDPNGRMYILKENESAARRFVKKYPNTPFDLISPLVIRANVGDLITVEFENKTEREASIHIQGVKYDVFDSDGAFAGCNPSSVTTGKIQYTWYADREGTFLFHDMGNVSSCNENGNLGGLFGALIVEAAGATWTDPKTGKELKSGCYADIHHPYKPDFREYVTIFHDGAEVYDKNGNKPIDPVTMNINYRSEAGRNQIPVRFNCGGGDASVGSWPFGDSSTPILSAYKGDPAKFRIINVGIKETHVFNLHSHQWQRESSVTKSTIIDSVSIGPQQCMDMVPVFGAGSLDGCIGDVIWHCHLYPHFMTGMWGLWRILDRPADGKECLPDGTPTPKLMPLPDRKKPPKADGLHPRFSNFLKGVFGKKAEKPASGITDKYARCPTVLEKANRVPNLRIGTVHPQPCPEEAPVKTFEICAVQLRINYNSNGWHDPEGRVFVLKKDKEAVLCGKKPVEPLVIRANTGDCIELKITNELPEELGGNAFQMVTKTSGSGSHIHLVKFGAINSYGSASICCLDASAIPGDTLTERFYADTELRTVFFYDHLFTNAHQNHGLFGALIIEPQGSTYHDIRTGGEIESGTQAIIKSTVNKEFREFALFVHDFDFLFDKDNNPLNPPKVPSSHGDHEVMGINYKCEPLHLRKGDPAYAYCSYVHGDPCTPLLETYEGDPLRIRLIDNAYREQHPFNISGLRWRKKPTDPASPYVQYQTHGISKAFDAEIYEDYKKGDYLYYFGGLDDLWLGLWGILRAHGERVPHLQPLSDRTEPPERREPLPEKTGTPPPKAVLSEFFSDKKPKNIKKFNVVAMQKDIVYNSFGDHDPNGLMFALAEDESAIRNGHIQPKPLILRANAGDFIELTLKNHLYNPIPAEYHPDVPVSENYPASNRVSMNCKLVKYNPMDSGGITVGFNPDQTIGVGEFITYRWYADEELGACLLTCFGDIRNHRHRGLFGALIVEPYGASYMASYPKNKWRFFTDEQISISVPGMDTFREFVIFMQYGVTLHDKNGNLIPDPSAVNDKHGWDYEDKGLKAFNYRNERLANRLDMDSQLDMVLSSRKHKDPSTPLFMAYINDPVRIRIIMPADKPENHAFVLHGHVWREQYSDSFSDIVSAQRPFGVGNAVNIELLDGANAFSGDYIYRPGAFRWDVEQGMWGIFRIYDHYYKRLAPINGNHLNDCCDFLFDCDD